MNKWYAAELKASFENVAIYQTVRGNCAVVMSWTCEEGWAPDEYICVEPEEVEPEEIGPI